MHNIKRERNGNVRGSIDLEVRVELFMDDGGSDRVRVEAYLEGKSGNALIGGVDIMPYPPNPMFKVIPHGTPFTKKGIELAISSALLGAAGPIVGDCISGNDDNRNVVRRSIEAKMDTIADAAFESAMEQAAKIQEPE